ncbi:MAG: hypothetical protein MPW15_02030 [Candidatus Manganitrophus sp.]|nr:hypothetical protein [Candidatus Manganitrophus sp.]
MRELPSERTISPPASPTSSVVGPAEPFSTFSEIVRRPHSVSPPEMEDADAVLMLGEDVTNVTAPRMALTLRQAVRQRQIAASWPQR